MTDIVEDVVEVDLFIDGQRWLLIDAKVELSKATTPNYVDLVMTPDPGTTLGNLPDDIQQLVGTSFSLEVDTELISNRNTDANEETLLFSGNLANISPTGENVYEGVAYDPGQQAFNEDDDGSLLNQDITIPQAEWDTQAQEFVYTIKTSELIKNIMQKAGITDYVIDLGPADEGITVTGENGSFTGGYDRILHFNESVKRVGEAIEQAALRTESEWWFDKEGIFHFGVPRPTKHEVRFITDTSAGITTPPYQSVKVVGSGVVSEQGWENSTMHAESKIVVEGRIQQIQESGLTSDTEEGDYLDDPLNTPDIIYGQLQEPVFTYRNAEISTISQARAVAKKVVKELGNQQADGNVTLVGFPEIVPFDAIKMPNTDEQPMGGKAYGVYKVTHRLNSSDGFITKVNVEYPSGSTRTEVSDAPNQNTTSAEPQNYTRSGRPREGGPGTGVGFTD